MSELPLLLAGPIVRRVSSDSAAVWVALSEAATVELHIFEGRQKSVGAAQVEGAAAPIGTGVCATRRMGAHLHIALSVVSNPDGAPGPRFVLRPSGIYSYDILIKRDGHDAKSLRELGLLQDDPIIDNVAHPELAERHIENVSVFAPQHLALGYEKDYLPSFVLPAPALKDVRMAHTSCRKSHGPGPDALAWLDDRIKDNLDKAQTRIQQLYLTGDQIYADDVPACILPMYHDLAMRLMGEGDASGEEELPSRLANGSPGPPVKVNMSTAPPMRRTVLVRSEGGFTSVECENHLLTVGEYAAAFLTAWSPRAWLALADEDRVYSTALADSPFALTKLGPLFTEKVGEAVPTTALSMAERLKAKNGLKFATQLQRVLVFASTIGKVARVLANTATYMIFDDHDVTDDWNLNREWMQRVYSHPLGRSVVRNALVVYAFFQGWGSDWPSYAKPDEKNGRILTAAEAYLATVTGRPVAERDKLDRLFNFNNAAAEEDRAVFHYEAPGSVFQVRVLDSRTRRGFPAAYTGAAALLGDSLDLQLPKHSAQAGDKVLIVVASTPVLGAEVFEQWVLPVGTFIGDIYRLKGMQEDTDAQGDQPGAPGSPMGLAMKRSSGASFADIETWPANPPAQHQLLSRLASYKHAVVLGGDVHYGTNIFMDWWERDPTIGDVSIKSGRIVQLTSSASRNALELAAEPIYRGWHWMNMWVVGKGINGFGIKEDGAGVIKLPAGKRPTMGRLHRMHEVPAILPADGWPTGTELKREPDWWFHQEQVRDMRKDEDRTGPFKDFATRIKPQLAGIAAAASAQEKAKLAVATHMDAMEAQFAPLREWVMTNNIGLISFQSDGTPTDAIKVVHELMSTTSQGYPEDDVDPNLPRKKPLGITAVASAGDTHTQVIVPLDIDDANKPRINRIYARD